MNRQPLAALLLICFLLLSGCASTPHPTSFADARQMDAQRAARQHAYPVTPEIQATRDRLIGEYRELLTQLFPSYNGIRVVFDGNYYGPEWGFLIADHSMFTPYTFDVGPAGPAVQEWITQHYADLQKARITAVRLGYGKASYRTGITPPQ